MPRGALPQRLRLRVKSLRRRQRSNRNEQPQRMRGNGLKLAAITKELAQNWRQTKESWQQQLNEELAQAQADFDAAKARNQSNFKARKIRIAEAHKASKKGALARIEDKEGRRKHKLQTETLQSERNRDAALANNEAT